MAEISSDLAVNYIQQRIVSGEYPMGRPLNTNVLAAEIGISRTPVREALRRLEAKGLVEIVPHLGARVRSLQINDFVEMCAMRQALEGYLAGAAAECRTDSDLRQMTAPIEAMSAYNAEMLARPEQEITLTELCGQEDIRFHVAVMSAARNQFVRREVMRLHLISRVATGNAPVVPTQSPDTESERAARNKRRAFVNAVHRGIFEAIRDRDSARARDLMEGHIREIIEQQVANATRDDRLGKKTPATLEEELYIAS